MILNDKFQKVQTVGMGDSESKAYEAGGGGGRPRNFSIGDIRAKTRLIRAKPLDLWASFFVVVVVVCFCFQPLVIMCITRIVLGLVYVVREPFFSARKKCRCTRRTKYSGKRPQPPPPPQRSWPRTECTHSPLARLISSFAGRILYRSQSHTDTNRCTRVKSIYFYNPNFRIFIRLNSEHAKLLYQRVR